MNSSWMADSASEGEVSCRKSLFIICKCGCWRLVLLKYCLPTTTQVQCSVEFKFGPQALFLMGLDLGREISIKFDFALVNMI